MQSSAVSRRLAAALRQICILSKGSVLPDSILGSGGLSRYAPGKPSELNTSLCFYISGQEGIIFQF